MTLRRQMARLLALFQKSRLERELNEEVTAHLELAERDALARGLAPADARREALRSFGGVAQVREIHREQRSTLWLENLLKDARYGLASLRREPLFAVVAIAVLALGIGANIAIFSIVDGVLLKPLPFPEPERLVRLWETPTATSVNATTALNFTELRRRLRTFEVLSAETEWNATAQIGGEPVRLQGRRVSANHFDVFAVRPLLGRTFVPDEDQPGHTRVIVISHAAWQQQFGADPGILTREVLLDGEPHRVIGVLPPGTFDRARARSDVVRFWKPLGLTTRQIESAAHFLHAVGRLRPGVSLEVAQQDALTARAQIDDQIPRWKRNWSVRVEPFDAVLIGDRLRQSLYVALGAVLFVLLIACANLTNLLLARGAARQKEIAVRSALGASRGRLTTQLLTESLVLGLLGGAAGVALAALLIRAAIPLLPVAIPFTAEITLNLRVLAFAAAIALAVSAIVGVLPALRLSASSASEALSTSRGSSARHDFIRRCIVGAEVAVSLVLICGSLLLFKSLLRLEQVDIGVKVPNVITASIDIARDIYPTSDHAVVFYDRLLAAVRAIPGVDAASLSSDLPLEGTGGENLRMPGTSEPLLGVRFKRAGAGYFETMAIPVMEGRAFTDRDRLGAPYVTVINEALAEQLRGRFGMADPVGKFVDLPALGYGFTTARESMQVVGIVKNERVRSDLRLADDPIAYVPLAQAPHQWTKLAVRTPLETAAMVPTIRQVLKQVDAHVALADVRTLEDLRELSLSGLKEPAWLIGGFAALSALLAALGLYGVVAHSVHQQRREIGIRMALGARANNVLSLIVRNITVTITAGVIVGLAGAAAVMRVTESLLFQVSALDPAAFAIAAVAMLAVGLVAAWIPASRATRVDPTTALRTE
jgi:putative ABC transport system permease protein